MNKNYSLSKRSLALFMAVLMAFSIFGITSVAIEDGKCDVCVDTDLVTMTVAPTCEDRGYDLTYCPNCQKEYARENYVPALGHDWDTTHAIYVDPTCTEVGGDKEVCKRCEEYRIVNQVPATGHSMSGAKYKEITDENGKISYHQYTECSNPNCGLKEYDMEEVNGKLEYVTYYKVDFINEFSTDKVVYKARNYYDCDESCDHDRIYDADDSYLGHINVDRFVVATEPKTIATIYVKSGATANYPSDINPLRDKDFDFASYKFTGWSNRADETATNPTENITQNTVLYANFEGVKLSHGIIFYVYEKVSDANLGTGDEHYTEDPYIYEVMNPISEQIVSHGEAASEVVAPERASTLYVDYKFREWSYDVSHVYTSTGVIAMYDEIPIMYDVEYYDWDGKLVGTDKLTYSNDLVGAPTDLVREANEQYLYSFTGNWLRENGEKVPNDFFTVPADTTSNEEPIKLYAEYLKKTKQYDVKLDVKDEKGFVAAGAIVTVLNQYGNLYTTDRLDENGQATLRIAYGTGYQIFIVTENNMYKTKDTFSVSGLVEPLELSYTLELNPDYNAGVAGCTCICHTFLGTRLWIPLLNLFYRLTGRKHVCCDDMYAVHGDKIAYA